MSTIAGLKRPSEDNPSSPLAQSTREETSNNSGGMNDDSSPTKRLKKESPTLSRTQATKILQSTRHIPTPPKKRSQ